MGKRLEDLPLDPASHAPRDPRDEAWYRFCEEIDELITSGDYAWASETLSGIRETVERTQAVTDGQRKAVANVAAAKGRADGWRRRRYEGWHR